MSNVLMTLDIDWAPDFVVDFVAEQLIEHQVRATWFVTHLSPAIEWLRQWPELFELGIHPNFLPGSTHGSTPTAVLEHCMAMVPDATSLRTHGLVQSTSLLGQILAQTPITTDLSLFLPRVSVLRPVEYYWRRRTLFRIPCFWEDDFEMERPVSLWHLAPLLRASEGIKVFTVHPIHIYLNSAHAGPYQALKQQVPGLSLATPTDVDAFVNPDIGTRTLFTELVEHLATSGQSARVRDVVKQHITSGMSPEKRYRGL